MIAHVYVSCYCFFDIFFLVYAFSTLKEGYDEYLQQQNNYASIYTYIHILVVEALNGIELVFDEFLFFLIKRGEEPSPIILLVFDDYV